MRPHGTSSHATQSGDISQLLHAPVGHQRISSSGGTSKISSASQEEEVGANSPEGSASLWRPVPSPAAPLALVAVSSSMCASCPDTGEATSHPDRSSSSSGRVEGAARVSNNEAPQRVQRQSSCITLPVTSSFAQWQSISEGFAALLKPEFVDIVFKVRGKPGLLGAHRALLAAAWPALREELGRVDQLPPREVRVESLRWVEAASRSGQATGSFAEPARTPPLSVSPATASPGRGVSPHPSEVPALSPQRSVARGDSQTSRLAEPDIEAPTVGGAVSSTSPGVMDVSAKMWGSYSITQALLSHLYSRPIAIAEREVPILRVAAMMVGCPELARNCDDVDRRPGSSSRVPLATTMPSRPSTPDPAEWSQSSHAPDGPPRLERGASAPAQAGGGTSSRSTSAASLSAAAPSHVAKGAEVEDSSSVGNSFKGTAGYPSGSPRELSPERRSPGAHLGPVRVSSRNHIIDRGGPRGGAENEKAKSEVAGVRRVLSDIKKSIVDRSRIIADKTFQQAYELVQGDRGILGEGVNGPVRLARHKKTGREVAVKRIRCNDLPEHKRQMLVSEVRIFLQVSHRNIVQLLEVYESDADQAVLLVMELCTGGELWTRLDARRWYSEFDAARVARQMLDAVSYLHSQNICHRDLKLENWLYENESSEARLKLCDFGFGQIVDPDSHMKEVLGTIYYVAPEVLDGSYGLPCDMWSIGVIVYMLLVGAPPFSGRTNADVSSNIKKGRFAPCGRRWEGISETAKHFVRSMLRRDPYERLTAAEAAQHAWLRMEVNPLKFATSTVCGPDSELELPIDRGVISDMFKFAQNNAISRAALGLLAKLQSTSFGGREEDVAKLERRFRSHDQQNVGKIDAEAFIQILKDSLHLEISTMEERKEEREFFERIARNVPHSEEAPVEHKGARRRREVDYREFIDLARARRTANNAAAIREAFRAVDTVGDGFIKEEAMHSLLGVEFKTAIENYVDGYGNELINYEHFANIVSLEMARTEGTDLLSETPKSTIEVHPPPREGLAPAEDDGREVASNAPSKGGGGSPTSGTQREPPSALPSRTHSMCSELEKAHHTHAAPDVSGLPDTEVSPVLSRLVSPADTGPKATELEEKEREREQARPGNEDEDKELGSEEEDENLDAGAQSDEEQLLNVKKSTSEWGADEAPSDLAEQRKQLHASVDKQPNAGRFQSFSLSLAGSAEYDDMRSGVDRVMSLPSDVYYIRQLSGFHSRTLRPFYSEKPVSNVVMGLIRGTSRYAKQSVANKLANIIPTTCGWFFIMPNPKYHNEVDSRKGLLSKETGKFRFVAWWIHPRFVPQLRQWFDRTSDQSREQRRRGEIGRDGGMFRAESSPFPGAGTGGSTDAGAGAGAGTAASMASPATGAAERRQTERGSIINPAAQSSESSQEATPMSRQSVAPTEGSEAGTPMVNTHNDRSSLASSTQAELGVGSPGDFRFSDVPKPENYLHTYRDLHSKEHVNMLAQLHEGTHRFLRSLFDETFISHAEISSGFHYPVRTQYATLHMQLRINSGSVCREDGRGMEVNQLINNLKQDRLVYDRDAESLRYHVTENVKVSLLAAAREYEERNPGKSAQRQTSPLAYELGVAPLPTIGEDDASDVSSNYPGDGPATPARGVSKEAEHGGVSRQIADPTDHETASYLVNLQPSPESDFYKFVTAKRQQCADLLGADPTYLYPLHVSVTGFFEATGRQIETVVGMMDKLLHNNSQGGVTAVKVGKVICTTTGYVLFDMKAHSITCFAKRLEERSQWELGIHIRAKAVNHISLASNRDEAAREQISAMYEDPKDSELARAYSKASFDLVLSRLLRRSSFERFAEDGPHQFSEVTRMPVVQVAPVAPVAQAPQFAGAGSKFAELTEWVPRHNDAAAGCAASAAAGVAESGNRAKRSGSWPS